MVDTIALVLSIIGTSVGATWLLRSKLSDIENALKAHVANDTQQFANQEARIIRLERRRR